MEKVILGVRMRGRGRIYDFYGEAGDYKKSDIVIVKTEQGTEIAVVSTVRTFSDADAETETRDIKPVLRKASTEDIEHYKDNCRAEDEAFNIASRMIHQHGLDMELVDVEYRFDNQKITFYFTSKDRVDFRMLVRDMVPIFKTRIELRQIGVRDEAKIVGGLGVCGRELCCASFLRDFRPVSIKMAKEQNLSMNPNKISGVCGKLLCCLGYENEAYLDAKKRLPQKNQRVMTPDGTGFVDNVNLLQELVTVRFENKDGTERKTYKAADLRYEAKTGEQKGSDTRS